MRAEDHHRYQEELAAYVLDALSPDEGRDFESHLAGCAACRAEEHWLQAAVGVLPASVEQLEPPPELRKRLMETVRSEAAAAERPTVRPGAPRRRLAFVLRPATALAVTAVAAAGVAGYLIGEGGGAGTTTVSAQATGSQPDARANIVRLPGGAELRVARLRVQRPGHVYQLWLKRTGQAGVEPSSLFVVRPNGSGSAAIPGGLEGVQAVMVTLEPERGSAKPTSRPIFRANL